MHSNIIDSGFLLCAIIMPFLPVERYKTGKNCTILKMCLFATKETNRETMKRKQSSWQSQCNCNRGSQKCLHNVFFNVVLSRSSAQSYADYRYARRRILSGYPFLKYGNFYYYSQYCQLTICNVSSLLYPLVYPTSSSKYEINLYVLYHVHMLNTTQDKLLLLYSLILLV